MNNKDIKKISKLITEDPDIFNEEWEDEGIKNPFEMDKEVAARHAENIELEQKANEGDIEAQKEVIERKNGMVGGLTGHDLLRFVKHTQSFNPEQKTQQRWWELYKVETLLSSMSHGVKAGPNAYKIVSSTWKISGPTGMLTARANLDGGTFGGNALSSASQAQSDSPTEAEMFFGQGLRYGHNREAHAEVRRVQASTPAEREEFKKEYKHRQMERVRLRNLKLGGEGPCPHCNSGLRFGECCGENPSSKDYYRREGFTPGPHNLAQNPNWDKDGNRIGSEEPPIAEAAAVISPQPNALYLNIKISGQWTQISIPTSAFYHFNTDIDLSHDNYDIEDINISGDEGESNQNRLMKKIMDLMTGEDDDARQMDKGARQGIPDPADWWKKGEPYEGLPYDDVDEDFYGGDDPDDED